MKHHVYFQMDRCLTPAILIAFWEQLPLPANAHSSK